MTMKKHIQTGAFFLLFVLFLLQDKLQEEIQLFQYFDEAFALLIVPLFFLHMLFKHPPVRMTRQNILFFALLVIFWVFGWAGYFVYRYQPLAETAKDAYVNIKFFLGVGASFLLFYDQTFDFKQLKKRLWPLLYAVTVVLFVMCLADAAFGVFSDDTRGNLPAVKLFYSAQTMLVACCVFLSAVFLWYYKEKQKKIILPLVLLSCIMFSTLRVKAVGAIACIVVIYLFVLLKKQKLSRKTLIFMTVVLCFTGAAGIYQVIRYYYLMGVESARAMLTLASPFVAMDHFPFGSGWGTFASAFSVEPYSPVYGMYRMAGIWGLSPDFHDFVSDTYWPMVLGQCGFFGFAALVGALLLFAKKVFVLKTDKSALASALLPLAYLLVSSTSESAFANPIAVMYAFWIGFLLAEHHAGRPSDDRSVVAGAPDADGERAA